MQQTTPTTPAPTPPAAPAPPPAQAPTVVVQTPAGPVPLTGLPTTPQELQGLRERRDILRDQLNRATNRRSELVRELDNQGPQALSAEARTGVQQRLALLDERILQIESDQAMTERLLSNAAPEVLALAAAESRSQQNMMSEDDAVFAAFSTFGLGILLTIVVGRLRRRFGRRRGMATAASAAALPSLTEDPRIDRLTHAVDAIAEEVERIGEGQRFVTQLLAARREPAAVLTGEERH